MRALITGVCGQDGWYLSEYLLELGYEVIGTRRGDYEPGTAPEGVKIVYGDVTDAICMRSLCDEYGPDEVYNFAAMSFIPAS